MLGIATPDYINKIREANKNNPEGSQIDDNFLPMEQLDDMNLIIKTLKEMPYETVAPYLFELEESAS